jgi:pilus assembly protein CpaF
VPWDIRTFVLTAARLVDLVDLGNLTHQAAVFLETIVRADVSVLVDGGTETGNTILLTWARPACP